MSSELNVWLEIAMCLWQFSFNHSVLTRFNRVSPFAEDTESWSVSKEPGALTLLQRAVVASSRALVHVLLPWFEAHPNHPLSSELCPWWQGEHGVTALHLSALLQDGK